MLERHAAFVLAYDQVDAQYQLTVQAVESVLAQDIGPLDLLLIDNGSPCGKTWDHFQMLRELYMERGDHTRIHSHRLKENIAPTKVINRALEYIWRMGHEKVMGCPNDVVLPPYFYRVLSQWPRGLITASEVHELPLPANFEIQAVSENTPMAVSVMRKWFYDALVDRDGYFFDENIHHYTCDCDLAQRFATCGIHGVQLSVPFWHYGSASHLLDPNGQNQREQADRDREYFERKWGWKCTSLEYGKMASDINFTGKGKIASA